MPPEVRQRMVAVKKAHPEYGPRRIADVLKRFFLIPTSQSTVHKTLSEEGLVNKAKCKPVKNPSKPRFFERSRPNQLWQSDIMTFRLAGRNAYLIGFIDDYSRQRDQRIANQGLQLLQHGKSFAVTGPSGAGKSTLVEHLLANLDTHYYHGLHIHYGGLQRTALLKTVGELLGVETNTRAVPLLVKLQKHVAMMATGKHPVHPVILVDDAQLLERESLMDICSLIVCPPKKAAAASLIIVGDDMLAKQMALAVMTPIRTRLTVNFRFEPLSEIETEQFISFRLRCAKAPERLFEPDALALIAAHCHGNRREIMNLGTLLLSEAYYSKEKTISAELFTDCDLIA